MHNLVLCLKVCYVVSLDIMYMITHIVDSALEIQQKAHHSCIYYIQSYCAIEEQEHHFCPPFHVHHHGAFGHDLQQDAWLLRWVMPSNMIVGGCPYWVRYHVTDPLH